MILSLLKFYKSYISPLFAQKGCHCKFYPTCSEYARQAYEKYGVCKASFYIIRRILKCNPFSKGGYDPLK